MASGSLRRWGLVGVLVTPLVAPLAVLASLQLGYDPVEGRARQPLVHREDAFVGSSPCVSCHPDHHASWARTFHRTMTQLPDPAVVRGAFDGRSLEYEGQTARPFRQDELFFMEVPAARGGTRAAQVALTVGSRRYQQYFERVEREGGFVFERLPFLWHIGAGRWLHMNTVFLGPDNPDWSKHRSRWNDNCVFCHNTGPMPRENLRAGAGGPRAFDSLVAELGISCESCHGPGASHAERYRDPLERYAHYVRGEAVDDIVNPETLDRDRSVAVCGQCHGQRIPASEGQMVHWLTQGPTFRSGERLTDHVTPVRQETPSPVEQLPDLFRLRFWGDGTPRLTAHEYQGVTTSPCYLEGELTCGSCHTMHGGDPRGMIEPVMRGDRACVQCHEKIGRDVRGHTKHDPARSGSRCMPCHMPRMVYGILDIHRSHRIENPDPKRDAEAGRPHACTTCHLDRSLVWSAEKMAEWWGPKYARPTHRADGAPPELPDFVASLLAGDAVQRAVYAWAGGREDRELEPEQAWLVRAALTVSLADGYPSVRWLARRSLVNLALELPPGLGRELQAWDPTAAASRGDVARRALDRLYDGGDSPSPGSVHPLLASEFMTAVRELLALQDDRVIDIGE